MPYNGTTLFLRNLVSLFQGMRLVRLALAVRKLVSATSEGPMFTGRSIVKDETRSMRTLSSSGANSCVADRRIYPSARSMVGPAGPGQDIDSYKKYATDEIFFPGKIWGILLVRR